MIPFMYRLLLDLHLGSKALLLLHPVARSSVLTAQLGSAVVLALLGMLPGGSQGRTPASGGRKRVFRFHADHGHVSGGLILQRNNVVVGVFAFYLVGRRFGANAP